MGIRYDGREYIDAYNANIVNDITVGNLSTFDNTLTISAGGTAITGNSTLGGNLALTGNLTGTGDITRTGNSAITGNITGTGNITRTGDSAITGDITGTGAITRTGTISLTNTTTGTAGMLVNSTDAAGDSQLELRTTGGSAYLFINQDGNTDFYSDEQIRFGHAGSVNTTSFWLGASTNSFSLTALELATTSSSGTTVTAGTVKVNPNSANIDFSASGDTVADLIKVDAGNDTFTLKAQTLPSTPSTGTLAIDSGDSNKLKFYNGTSWTDTANTVSEAQITTNMAQNSIDIIELQANTGVTPNDHDYVISETFSDSNGFKNTLTANTATFDTNKFKNVAAATGNSTEHFKGNSSLANDGTSDTTVSGTPVYSTTEKKLGSACFVGTVGGTLVHDKDDSLASNYAFSFWVKFKDSAWDSSRSGFARPITQNVGGPGTGDFHTHFHNNGTFEFGTEGESTLTTAKSSWTANTWYHVIMNVSSSGAGEIFVDNVSDVTQTGMGEVFGGSPTQFFFAQADASETDVFFDDFRIFDHELTSSERSTLYNSGSGTENALYASGGVTETVTCDLASVTGTVTDFMIFANLPERETGDSVTFTLKDSSENSQTGIALNTKTTTTLASNPDEIIINLTQKTTAPTAGYPSCKSFAVVYWT